MNPFSWFRCDIRHIFNRTISRWHEIGEKLRSIILVIIILALVHPCLSYRDPLVGRDSIISLADGVGAQAFDSISRQIANDPYNPNSSPENKTMGVP